MPRIEFTLSKTVQTWTYRGRLLPQNTASFYTWFSWCSQVARVELRVGDVTWRPVKEEVPERGAMQPRVCGDGRQRAHVVLQPARQNNVTEIPLDLLRGLLPGPAALPPVPPGRLPDQLWCAQPSAQHCNHSGKRQEVQLARFKALSSTTVRTLDVLNMAIPDLPRSHQCCRNT